MQRRPTHLSLLLSGILGVVSVTLVMGVVLSPELPAAPSPTRRTVSPAMLDPATPSALQGMTLEWLYKELRASSSRRRAAVERLLRAERADAPMLHRWLHRKTSLSPADYRNMLRQIGAHVPDQRGRFGPDQVKNPDWLEALLAIDPDTLPSYRKPAHVETLLSVALMRALVATKHPDASISLLRFGYRHVSAFKDECGRQIRALRVHAVPGLIRAQALRDPLAYKMVRYAAYQLDRIDCVRPDRALKQADPDLRAEIIHAYGEIRDPTAVRAVLKQAAASTQRVRRAARWAMLRYVSGRPPRVIKRKLKLAGGKETTTARALYLTYRQLAQHALLDRLAQEIQQGSKPPSGSIDEIRRQLNEENEPRHLAERLFALLDRRQKQNREQALALALSRAQAGNLTPALAEFDRQLALDPYHPRRDAMAVFYYRQGEQLQQQGKTRQALALLTKAMHLDPAGSFIADGRTRRDAVEAALDRSGAASSRSDPRPSLRPHGRLWLVGVVATAAVVILLLSLTIVRRRLCL